MPKNNKMCLECQGTGYVKILTYSNSYIKHGIDLGIDTENVKCDKCSGTGKINKKRNN